VLARHEGSCCTGTSKQRAGQVPERRGCTIEVAWLLRPARMQPATHAFQTQAKGWVGEAERVCTGWQRSGRMASRLRPFLRLRAPEASLAPSPAWAELPCACIQLLLLVSCCKFRRPEGRSARARDSIFLVYRRNASCLCVPVLANVWLPVEVWKPWRSACMPAMLCGAQRRSPRAHRCAVRTLTPQ